jgi:predicted nucleic acid-binding protein
MSLKLPDAVHLMSAIRSECGFIVTGDSDFNKLPSGMRRVRPDQQGIDSLLQQLA